MEKQTAQLTVNVQNDNEDFLKVLQKELEGFKSEIDFVSEKNKQPLYVSLRLYIAKNKLSSFKVIFIEAFSNAFLYYFKFKFLESRIGLLGICKNSRTALIKALTYFDKQSDKLVIEHALKDFDDSIFVESLLKFKLHILERRWQEIVFLANENAAYFLSSETFLELLRFLIANLETEKNLVYVNFADETYSILDENKTELIHSSIDDDVFIITKLIGFAPKKIVITSCGLKSNGAINLICDLFEGKVEVNDRGC